MKRWDHSPRKGEVEGRKVIKEKREGEREGVPCGVRVSTRKEKSQEKRG